MAETAVGPKSVRRVIVLSDDGPVTLHKGKKKKRKKQSRWLKPFEKAERRLLKGTSRGLETYRVRRERSNRKKKNGWLRDMPKNLRKAAKKAEKKIKIRKL